jgi:hypothetical protein
VDEKGKPFQLKGRTGVEDGTFMMLDAELNEPLYQFVLLGPDHLSLEADEKGRITVPYLIPGADYRFPYGNKREIKAEAGKTHDLGEMTIRFSGSNVVPF